MKKRDNWAGIEQSLLFAQASLAMAPGAHLILTTKSKKTRENIAKRSRFIERHEPNDGDRLVLRAVLPIDLCPLLNDLTRSHFGRKTQEGNRVFDMLLEQNRFDRGELVPGRPLVRCIRFSVNEPDEHDASWTKVPIDVLVDKGEKHMGLLLDDRKSAAEVRPWWEPAPRACQCVYLDVWEREGNKS